MHINERKHLDPIHTRRQAYYLQRAPYPEAIFSIYFEQQTKTTLGINSIQMELGVPLLS